MDEIHFRCITPLFRFKFDNEDKVFLKFGVIKKIKYDIEIKKYNRGKEGFDSLLQIANNDASKCLVSLGHSEYGHTDYYAVLNLYYSNRDADKNKHCGNTEETNDIVYSIIKAIKLNAQAGVSTNGSYILRKSTFPSLDVGNLFGFGNCVPIGTICKPWIFSHLGKEESVLLTKDFENLDKTIDFIMNQEDSQFHRIINLAFDYFYYSFVNENPVHSFLFMIIICDTLFKKDEKENNSKVSSRISRYIKTYDKSIKNYNKLFYQDNSVVKRSSFYQIRNMIAHGNINITKEEVKKKYKELFPIVRKILVKLITDKSGKLDKNNYFESLDNMLEIKRKQIDEAGQHG
ncbi:MAG TPA: HEPN domain-containing protein [Spirochaetota bacterium]|nr:HEPN domain-containing protein [Spirochaetota bacterium]HOR43547.1 HEPN domain-containing protein [Spirochaetota bacterium]HPK55707.1 HEPN domain-containing protein [Spirochaetota bacterium]